MTRVVVTIKIMPESPDTALNPIENQAKEKIKSFTQNEEMKSEQEPIAFGLKALKITFVMDEQRGSTEALESDLKTISGVNSIETVDVRRAVG